MRAASMSRRRLAAPVSKSGAIMYLVCTVLDRRFAAVGACQSHNRKGQS
jgi:hypothetical protein